MEVTNEMRAAVYNELLSDDWDINNAMLRAASTVKLERENGGLEYPAIRGFRVMLIAAASALNVNMTK